MEQIESMLVRGWSWEFSALFALEERSSTDPLKSQLDRLPRMADGVKGTVAGLEDGRLWLPAHILHDLWDSKECLDSQQDRRFSLNAAVPRQNHYTKAGWKFRHNKPRYSANRSSTKGGPGMHVLFLESGQRSCGTGFFLPRRAGAEFQRPGKGAGCSTVLLPSRVVQALTFNVHQIGSSLSSQKVVVTEGGSKKEVFSDGSDGNGAENATLDARSSSPETYLPKEWTY